MDNLHNNRNSSNEIVLLSETFYEASIWTFFVFGCFSLAGDMTVLLGIYLMNQIPELLRQTLFILVTFQMGNTFYLMWGNIIVLDEKLFRNVTNCFSNNNGSTNETHCTPPSDDSFKYQNCIIQAFVSNILCMVIYYYICGMSVLILVSNFVEKIRPRYVYMGLAFPWFIIFPIVGAAAARDAYGYSPCTVTPWCFVKYHTKQKQSFWFYVTDAVWEMAMQLTVYVSYFVTIAISIHKRAQTMGGNTSGDAQEANFIAPDPDFRLRRLLQSTDLHVTLFPLSFSLCYLPGFVDYVIRFDSTSDITNLEDNAKNRTLSIVHGIATSSTGICNFLMFVLFNEPVRDRILTSVWSKVTLKKRRASQMSSNYLVSTEDLLSSTPLDFGFSQSV